MELTIDKFGRVVLPKKIREHLGVGPGLKVTVTETANGVTLEPAGMEPELVAKGGLLVFEDGPEEPMDWGRLVREDREERIRHILGV